MLANCSSAKPRSRGMVRSASGETVGLAAMAGQVYHRGSFAIRRRAIYEPDRCATIRRHGDQEEGGGQVGREEEGSQEAREGGQEDRGQEGEGSGQEDRGQEGGGQAKGEECGQEARQGGGQA